jgi:hypothetical protein
MIGTLLTFLELARSKCACKKIFFSYQTRLIDNVLLTFVCQDLSLFVVPVVRFDRRRSTLSFALYLHIIFGIYLIVFLFLSDFSHINI